MKKFWTVTGVLGVCLASALAQEVSEACIQWDAAWPDVTKADAGFDDLPGVKHYTIFPGSQKLGMFNHGPMIYYYNGKLFVTWFSHDKYEDSAGTRALYSYSSDFRFWSEPAVLIDSIGEMADKGTPGTALWPEFEEVNGRLYVTATVKQIVSWTKDGTALVPVYRDLDRVVKRVYGDGTPAANRYWLAESIPEGYETMGIAPYTQEEDAEMRADMAQLEQRWALRRVQYALPETEDENVAFCEPTYFVRPDGKEVGVYRDVKRSMRLYAAIRDTATDSWSLAEKSNIPDSPSKTAAGNLPDGRAYIVGNFLDKLWLRDPLLIAFSDDGISFDQVYTVRCGASQCREKNPGDHKGPGYQYPNALVVGDILWVAYSVSKEQIAISSIPATGNLIENAGFESGNNAPSSGWASRLTENAVGTYVSGAAGLAVHSGVRAVSISHPEGDVERWYLLNSASPAINAGTAYEFSAWVKAGNMSLASAYIQIDWLNSDDARIGSEKSSSISSDQDWGKLTVSGTAPEGTVKLRPMLMVDGTAGSDAVVTFDDCMVLPNP
ncbi:MAG: exo-alpha-sialidase [Kiritimatiellales bacterium]